MRVGKIFAKYFNKNISTMEEKDKNINENGCADSTVEGNDVDTNTENAAGEKAAALIFPRRDIFMEQNGIFSNLVRGEQ